MRKIASNLLLSVILSAILSFASTGSARAQFEPDEFFGRFESDWGQLWFDNLDMAEFPVQSIRLTGPGIPAEDAKENGATLVVDVDFVSWTWEDPADVPLNMYAGKVLPMDVGVDDVNGTGLIDPRYVAEYLPVGGTEYAGIPIVVIIPEPATLGLAAIGLAATAVLGRRGRGGVER